MINNITDTMTMTPIPAAAADLSATSTSTSSTPITAAVAVRNDKPERNLWREQEMLTVLQIIRERKLLPLLNDKTVRSETVFRKVEKDMNDRGYCKKNHQQIWTKWKFLKSTYMTSRRVHQIPKIIPLEVYESLDELLSAEFQNDGSMSSYDGGDYEDSNMMGCGGGGDGGYEMNASISTTGSNDGFMPVISSVQGGLQSASSTTSLYNGGKNYPDFNGFGVMRRNKFKNGFRSSFKMEEDTNGFGMQHPIFGYRLGVVKDEPVDNEYENNNNTPAQESFSEEPAPELCNTIQQFPVIKPELASPPPSPPLQEDDHLPVPVTQRPSPQQTMPPLQGLLAVEVNPVVDPHMPPLHRYTPPSYLPPVIQPESQKLPPLKQMPLMKIQLPPKPQAPQIVLANQVTSTPIPTQLNSKKIPVLTLRKRKKRLNIPNLCDGTNSPAPSSKHSKISDEDDPRESPPETSRIPFVTYGKAMREMSASLRDIQREMIDDFFKQQMDLAKSEHEFQKQQDAMLLRCFEDQTKLLLDGARRLFTSNQGLPIAPDIVFVNNE